MYSIVTQILHNPFCPPCCLMEGQDGVRGVAEGNVLTVENLVAQVISAFIGGIKPQLYGIVGSDVVDECPSVTAKSCSVAYYPLGIIAYDEFVVHLFLKCLNTNLTSTKFVGTAIANTANGAISRLRPIQRKKLNSTMCNR